MGISKTSDHQSQKSQQIKTRNIPKFNIYLKLVNGMKTTVRREIFSLLYFQLAIGRHIKNPLTLKICTVIPSHKCLWKNNNMADLVMVFLLRVVFLLWKYVSTSPQTNGEYILFNPLTANPTKWSNTLKQFLGNRGRIIWVCLTISRGWRLKS